MTQPTGRPNRVLLINDMAGYGKVALSVMIPVFTHLKYETFNLPTALVSNTLDYGRFEILDTTAYMQGALKAWEELGFSFDVICTGFITSVKQAELVYRYGSAQRARGTRIFVDPILGDDGKLYNGVGPESVEAMRRLCSIGDVVMPNITEACLLAGRTPQPLYTQKDLEEISESLHRLGARALVLTSVPLQGRMVTAVKPSPSQPLELLPYEEIPVRFPGTGDIFMSLTAGRCLRTGRLTESVRAAMTQVEALIRASLSSTDRYKGIPIEQLLEEIQDEEA